VDAEAVVISYEAAWATATYAVMEDFRAAALETLLWQEQEQLLYRINIVRIKYFILLQVAGVQTEKLRIGVQAALLTVELILCQVVLVIPAAQALRAEPAAAAIATASMALAA
jgi:hypothetical protein